MKLQHTQGKWEAFQNNFGVWRVGNFHEEKDIARQIHNKHDAMIIAAAPEMLEALIKVLSDPYDDKELYKRDVRMIIEIIERATGISIEEIFSQ
jgi:hypothetical protein